MVHFVPISATPCSSSWKSMWDTLFQNRKRLLIRSWKRQSNCRADHRPSSVQLQWLCSWRFTWFSMNLPCQTFMTTTILEMEWPFTNMWCICIEQGMKAGVGRKGSGAALYVLEQLVRKEKLLPCIGNIYLSSQCSSTLLNPPWWVC